MDHGLGQQDAAGLGHADRGGAQVLAEQAAQMPLAHPQPRGQGVDVALI